MFDSREFLHQLTDHRKADQALDNGNGVTLTYATLSTEVAALARLLQQNNVQGLALEFDNSPAWVVADLAAMSATTWTLPLPPFFTAAQRSHALEQSGCEFLLTDNDRLNNGNKTCVTVATRTLYLYKLKTFTTGRVHPDTAKVTFTSGSTGSPKGLCLSSAFMFATANAITETLEIELVDRHLSVLPLSLLLENIAGVYAALLRGKTCVLPPLASMGLSTSLPDFSRLNTAMQSTSANSCILVPELLQGLLYEFQRTEKPKNLRYIAVGGAKTASGLLAQATSMQLPVFEGYGLSEAASVVSVNTPTQSRLGSTGQLLPHQSITIDNEGQIWLKEASFLGYCNDKTTTPSPFPTGDLGWQDTDGYLHISGRKKNLLITSMARNISPEWVETELNAEPEIMQCLVYGDAERQLSALIVPLSENANEIEQATKSANRRLPDYASIGHVKVVAPFTQHNGMLTGNGKLRRQAILSHYVGP